MTTILVTTDFYSEFELYETTDPDDLKEYLTALYNGESVELDETKHTLLGSHDDISADDARAAADEIIYNYELAND